MRSEIVQLRHRDGLSYAEIAARLGVSRGFVAGHLYRERNGMGVRKPPAAPRPVTTRVRGRKPARARDPATLAALEAIERSGLTDIDIADRVGIGVSTIRAWRAGVQVGRPQFLEWVHEAVS